MKRSSLFPEHRRRTAELSSSGFTLLELLLSLTIVSIIVILVFSALRIGIRAWEKGEQDIDVIQEKRIVRDILEKQIKSILPERIRVVGGKEVMLFKGDEKTMEFVTGVSFDGRNRQAPVYVRVVFESGPDFLNDLRWVEREHRSLKTDQWPEEIDRDQYRTILGGLKNGGIEYLKPPEGEGERQWTRGWNPLEQSGLPEAIRITMEREDMPGPFQITARVFCRGES